MQVLRQCESCFCKYRAVYCCSLCARVVCNKCIGVITYPGESNKLNDCLYSHRPCYRCTALVIIPRLRRCDLEKFDSNFLEEMLLFFENEKHVALLYGSEGALDFLVANINLTANKLQFYQLKWSSLIPGRSDEVEKAVRCYISYGNSEMPTLAIKPRDIRSKSPTAKDS